MFQKALETRQWSVQVHLVATLQILSCWMRQGVITEHGAKVESRSTPRQRARMASLTCTAQTHTQKEDITCALRILCDMDLMKTYV